MSLLLFRILLSTLSVDVTRLQADLQLLLTSITKTRQTIWQSHSISIRFDRRITITKTYFFQPGPHPLLATTPTKGKTALRAHSSLKTKSPHGKELQMPQSFSRSPQ